MAEYHVRVKDNGEILTGTLNKNGKFTNSSVVTEEVLAAARDHLLIATQRENQPVAYAWTYPNGKTLIMKLEEQDTESIKEEEEKENKE